jgi:hypothetical protein
MLVLMPSKMLLYSGVIITVFLEPYSDVRERELPVRLYAGPRSISETKAKHLSSATITYWCANNLISEDDPMQYSQDKLASTPRRSKEPQPKDE